MGWPYSGARTRKGGRQTDHPAFSHSVPNRSATHGIHLDTNQVPRLLADRRGEIVLTGNTRPSWYPIRVRVYRTTPSIVEVTGMVVEVEEILVVGQLEAIGFATE